MEPVSWTTLEFEPRERHRDWNWYAGLIAVITAVLAFFYGNIFFGIFAIIAGITVIIYAVRPPKHLAITINAEGVSINGDIIPSASITQFWLDETDKQDKLLLLVKGAFIPLLALPLQGVSAAAVRAAMAPLAPELELKESRTIKIFEGLGF
jgi:hypothetical protein